MKRVLGILLTMSMLLSLWGTLQGLHGRTGIFLARYGQPTASAMLDGQMTLAQFAQEAQGKLRLMRMENE